MERDLKIGVIGTGRIGIEHIKTINNRVSGAYVSAVATSSVAKGAIISEKYGIDRAMTPIELIESLEVDAVVIASTGESHENYVLRCIENKKPVFCEKPLAIVAAGCKKIMEAEEKSRLSLVQVGFMRRFDKHHMQIYDVIDSKNYGKPLMIHAIHRNPEAPESFNDAMLITDVGVHEFDVLSWILKEDYISKCTVYKGAPLSGIGTKLSDPQLIILKTKSGVIIDIELFVNARYGLILG